jgi:hypothetical protein
MKVRKIIIAHEESYTPCHATSLKVSKVLNKLSKLKSLNICRRYQDTQVQPLRAQL